MKQTELQLTGGSGKTERRELDFYPTPKRVESLKSAQGILKERLGDFYSQSAVLRVGEIESLMEIYAQRKTDHAITVINNRIAELEYKQGMCDKNSRSWIALHYEIIGAKDILTLLQS